MTNPDLIRQARAALDAGDSSTARRLLTQLIRAPGGAASGEAWWLLGQALEDPAQKQDCLQRARAAGYSEPAPQPAPAGQDDLMSWLAEMSSAPAQPAAPARRLDPDLPPPPPLPDMTALSEPQRHQPPQAGAAPLPPASALHEFVAPTPPAQAPGSVATAPPEPPPLDLPNLFSSPGSAATVQAAPPAPPPATGADSQPYAQADIDMVIELLGQDADHNEVIRNVIRRCDCSLSEAEALVRYVHLHHGGRVAKKKLPLIMMIVVVMLLSGLSSLGYAAFMVVRGTFDDNLLTLRYFGASLFFGVVLTVGSLIGMVRALRAASRR